MPKVMRDQKSNLKHAHSTIKGCCSMDFIIENYIEKRDKYDALKIKYEKSKVFEEQKIQLKRDYDDKLNIIAARNKLIENQNSRIKKIGDGYEKITKNLHKEISEGRDKFYKLEKEFEYMKSSTVSKDDYDRLDSYAKKRDEIIIEQNKKIEELSAQVNSTKINGLEHLKNTIRLQKEQIIHLKEGYGKFNLEEDEKLQKENEKLKEENKNWEIDFAEEREEKMNLRAENETLKEEKEVFIKTIQKYKEYSTLMFDIETPLADD